MKLFTKKNDYIRHWRLNLSNQRIGLVPTMGNLHQGHLNLVETSLNENQHTIVTIFVNPKQFGPHEDFEKYPRTIESDLNKLKALSNSEKIIVIAPDNIEEVFPKNFSTDIEVKGLDNALCGKHRSGHFKGVTTVVYQLFSFSRAQQAYFGQKDYQQFKIIEKMVKDLDIPIDLTMVPIAREKSGLALSSRNQYLSMKQKEEAASIFKTLSMIGELYCQDQTEALKKQQETLFKDPSWQYLEILDADTLSGPNQDTQEVVVAGAYLMGDTRLIDNIIVRP